MSNNSCLHGHINLVGTGEIVYSLLKTALPGLSDP